MIWLAIACLILASLLFLCAPLYRAEGYRAETGAERQIYLAEIERLEHSLKTQTDANEGEDEVKRGRKIELERQLLASVGREFTQDKGPQTLLLTALFIGLSCATFALYALLGRPDLVGAAPPATQALSQSGEPELEKNMSFAQLVERLQSRLVDTPDNSEGWILYARSLMTLGRYAEAFEAYERVLSLTGNAQAVSDEYTQARTFAESRTLSGQGGRPQVLQVNPKGGPSPDDVSAASEMTPEDRQAMIQGMVDGLSAKLTENPNDPEGWIRLLRSRKILGQTQAAETEIKNMRQYFSQDLETKQRILEGSGWN